MSYLNANLQLNCPLVVVNGSMISRDAEMSGIVLTPLQLVVFAASASESGSIIV